MLGLCCIPDMRKLVARKSGDKVIVLVGDKIKSEVFCQRRG